MPNTFKLYLNIAKKHVDVMTQSLFGFCWFFTIFVINVLQNLNDVRTFCLKKIMFFISILLCYNMGSIVIMNI